MPTKDFSVELEVLQEAQTAAAQAAKALIDQNPNQWYPCGFSWVRIRPARGKLIDALKRVEIGRTDDFEGGYVVYNPSGNSTQWMDAKMAGSRVYADKLNAYFTANGIKAKAKAEERID